MTTAEAASFAERFQESLTGAASFNTFVVKQLTIALAASHDALVRRVEALERTNSSESPNSSPNTVAISAIRLRRDGQCICVDIDRGTGDWRNVERQILDDPRWLEATTYYAGLVDAEAVNVDGGPVEAMRHLNSPGDKSQPADPSAAAGKVDEESGSVGQDLIDGLTEFNAKLASGEPIHGMRIERNQDGTVTQTPVTLQPKPSPATASESDVPTSAFYRTAWNTVFRFAIDNGMSLSPTIRGSDLNVMLVWLKSLAADRQRIAELERQFADKDRDLALQIANATLLARERDTARADAEAAHEKIIRLETKLDQACAERNRERDSRAMMLCDFETAIGCDPFETAMEACRRVRKERDDLKAECDSLKQHYDPVLVTARSERDAARSEADRLRTALQRDSDEFARLQEQITAMTKERDGLRAQLQPIPGAKNTYAELASSILSIHGYLDGAKVPREEKAIYEDLPSRPLSATERVKWLTTASNTQADQWKERATRAEERLAALVKVGMKQKKRIKDIRDKDIHRDWVSAALNEIAIELGAAIDAAGKEGI